MKKTLVVLCSLLLLTSMFLFGCGSKSEEVTLSGPVKIIVGSGAGGGLDTAARGVQPFLQEVLGVPVVVENMPGSGHRVAASFFNKSKPDGNTLFMFAIPLAPIVQLMYKPDFDYREFTPIYKVVGGDYRVITVNASSPFKSFDDLKNASKSGVISAAGTGGKGGVSHLQSIYLEKLGIPHKYVPFDSGAEGTAALLGGHVDFALDSTTSCVKYVKEGKVRVIAVHGPKRMDAFPDSPTFDELGYKDMILPFHIGAYAPPKTPNDIADYLEKAFEKATKDPKFVEWAKNSNIPITPASAAEWKKDGLEWYDKINAILPMIESAK